MKLNLNPRALIATEPPEFTYVPLPDEMESIKNKNQASGEEEPLDRVFHNSRSYSRSGEHEFYSPTKNRKLRRSLQITQFELFKRFARRVFPFVVILVLFLIAINLIFAYIPSHDKVQKVALELSASQKVFLAEDAKAKQKEELEKDLIEKKIRIMKQMAKESGQSRPEKKAKPLIDTRNRIQLEEILKGDYQPFLPKISWLSDHELIYQNENQDLIKVNALINKTSVLLPKEFFEKEKIHEFKISANQKFLLLASSVLKRFRYSYDAIYQLYDLNKKKLIPLPPSNGGKDASTRLQYCTFGPAGEQIAFIDSNNVYYKATSKAMPMLVNTATPEKEDVFNGLPDWMYEEEILKAGHAIRWSPEGSKLAFLSFDDTKVNDAIIPFYGNLHFQYSSYRTLKYPKVC